MAPHTHGDAPELRTLVIIPTYNERDNVERLCQAVLAGSDAFEILVVDDNSPDGTGEVVSGLSRDNPRIHLLRRAGKLGLGTAHIAGYRWALRRRYARVLTMDADFSHPPDRIPAMIRETRRCHVVIGSRYVEGGGHKDWPVRRVFLSGLSNWVARTCLGLKPRDCTGAFRCFRREALEAVPVENIRARGYAFQVEMMWQCSGRGWELGEVPITFVDRAAGTSKICLAEILGAIWAVARLRFTPHGQREKDGC